MTARTQYVAVVKKEDRIEMTYVFEGNSTLDEVFTFIDDRRFIGGQLHGISVYRDESRQPSLLDTLREVSSPKV